MLVIRKSIERKALRGLENVIIDERSVDFSVHFKRFLNIDCLVNISTGEGFSIQPREAMALGIPVIVSDNTAQTTLCATGLVKRVPSNILIPAHYPWPGDFGFQYDCRTCDVAAALQDVYKNYDKYLRNAALCREWASSCDLMKVAPIYLNLIKPKRVMLGDKDVLLPDGIMTTSQKLATKYKSALREHGRHKKSGRKA